MREEIKKLIEKSIKTLQKERKLPDFEIPEILVEKPKEKEYGDYATNIAMVVGKEDPIKTAEMIKSKVKSQKSKVIEKVEVVEPGFINFFLAKEYLQKQVHKVKISKIGRGKKINVEFISANPTGPLTLGNGRGGFCGDVLANVLEKAGYNVCREYYINDRGKQIEDLKKGLYKGEKRSIWQIQKENQRVITKKLKIKFDVWFSEKSLYKSKEVDRILDYLKKKELSYKKDRALWFKSTKFGDDKDRVLVKADGEKTYFASEIAYLKNKFDRGFEKLIFFWGADHAGYVNRTKAAIEALGYKKEQADFIIVQLVRLFEGVNLLKMSKRAGRFITLEELVDKVGLDVARFFFLQRSSGSHLNFDFSLAKEKSEKNPVYYVQYAYARICSILKRIKNYEATLRGVRLKASRRIKNLKVQLLNHPSELDLIKQLIRFPEIIEDTAKDYQVQRLPNYALELVTAFHRFYEDCRVISRLQRDRELSRARLSLVLATQKILKNTLDSMSISSPTKM